MYKRQIEGAEFVFYRGVENISLKPRSHGLTLLQVIVVNNVVVKSKISINVLGVTFDSKLNWSIQVAQSIMKAKRSLHAIKLIKIFFTELTTSIKSCCCI